MRSIKSGLLGCLLAGLFGAVAVVGCSASGDSVIDPSALTPAEEDPSVAVPADNDDDDNGSKDAAVSTTDAGKKDGGSKDAGKDSGKDAGKPAPEPGTACATVDDIFKRSCGKCGMQEALCVPTTDGSPGGVVNDYGVCKNENAAGCVPGSTEDVACGNCGTQKRTCSNFCQWSAPACTGEPMNSCTPGAVELTGASCGANLYRQRSCKAACTWDTFSSTCAPPPTFVLVPPNPGSVNSTIAVLETSKTTTRVPYSTTCPIPAATVFPATQTPYAYVEVRNTNPKAVTVTIYNSKANGGSEVDTIMAVYDGTTIPTTETARRACKVAVRSSSTTALTGNYAFASFEASLNKGVLIPANSSVQVYFAAEYAYSSTDPGESTGMVVLNVKTESVNP